MKDFISKITFGFFMAQLVPGVIVIYSLSLLYYSIHPYHEFVCLSAATNQILDFWSDQLKHVILFLGLSIASGMLLHGLQWAILGFLENHYAINEEGKTAELASLADLGFHKLKPIYQILLGPGRILYEIYEFLFKAKGIKELAIEENVGDIDESKMEGFNFLQDFYLHFAQFYAHTSYALLILFMCLIPAIVFHHSFNYSWWHLALLALIWVMSGFFFLISRIQLTALFSAEWSLKKGD